jgi:hypothetical protein
MKSAIATLGEAEVHDILRTEGKLEASHGRSVYTAFYHAMRWAPFGGLLLFLLAGVASTALLGLA